MNLPYIIPRFIRKLTPAPLINALLQKGIFMKPGLETGEPKAALSQYLKILEKQNFSIEGKTCLLFGYGGYFALACMLLEKGAAHVILCDKYAYPYKENLTLLPKYKKYLKYKYNQIIPHSDFITLHHADIKEYYPSNAIDVILSMSVFEHLQNVKDTVQALSALTNSQGIHIHFIDLRDHYFKYPFEMLCYSEQTWHKWLNPSSHLNRYRMQDYQSIFESYFLDIQIKILERNLEEFQAIHSRIDKKFLTGDDNLDSVTNLLIIAKKPCKE